MLVSSHTHSRTVILQLMDHLSVGWCPALEMSLWALLALYSGDSGISPGLTFVLKWKARCGCWGQNTLTYVIMLFHEPGQTPTAASETDFLMVESDVNHLG